MCAQGPSIPKLTVQFNLSIGCNATCFMCDKRIWNKKSRKTYSNLIKLLNFLDTDTVNSVKLQGGEPLLDKKGLLLFLRVCRLKGLYCFFPTNGSLFTKSYFDNLVNAGLQELTISVDSCRAHEHDRIRGLPGMFKRILSILTYIRKEYPDFKLGLNFLVFPQNIDALNDTICFAQNLGIKKFNVLYPENFGKNFDQIRLTAQAFERIEYAKQLHKNSAMAIHWNPQLVNEDAVSTLRLNKISIFEDGTIHFSDNPALYGKYKLNRPLKEILENQDIKKLLNEHCLSVS